MTKLTPCKFYFGDNPTFDGLTDGTTWNGFDNVWVTPEVHRQIVKHFREDYIKLGYTGNDLAYEMESFNISPSGDGLYSYANGFATSIED